jgi:hypothetical protein
VDQPSEPRVVQIVPLSPHVDEAYRAIGHYYVAFASLISLMRQILTEEVAAESPKRAELARLALAGLEAMRVADAFFAVCRTVGGLADDDLKIEKVLRERHVYKAITRRNEIAHGDWHIRGWATSSDATVGIESVATLVRVQAREADQSEHFTYEDLSAKDIEAEANGVEALERMICEFGCICTKQGEYAPDKPQAGVRVRDLFEVIGRANHKSVALRPRNSPELWPNSPS